MPNTLFFALLGTFGYFLLGNSYDAYSTYASIAAAEQIGQADLYAYHRAVALSVLRAAVCAAALSVLLLARQVRTAQFAGIGGISLLILTMLPNAPVVYRVVSALGLSGSAGVLPFVLSFVWLLLLLAAVLSNYAFKRTAGRIHRVS